MSEENNKNSDLLRCIDRIDAESIVAVEKWTNTQSQLSLTIQHTKKSASKFKINERMQIQKKMKHCQRHNGPEG